MVFLSLSIFFVPHHIMVSDSSPLLSFNSSEFLYLFSLMEITDI